MEASVIDDFEKDRKDEKRFYALINFFKLLIIGEAANNLTTSQFCFEDCFAVLGGMDVFNKLLDDITNNNINFSFANGQKKSLEYLLRSEAYDLFTSLSDIKNTQSTLLIQAFQSFETIINYFDKHGNKEFSESASSENILYLTVPLNLWNKLRSIEIENYQKKLKTD